MSKTFKHSVTKIRNSQTGEFEYMPTLKGNDGTTPHIGENNHWWIGDVDTGVDVRGEKGDDGTTPHIGANNHWYIGNTDTGVTAQGADGYTPQKGVDYTDGIDGKSAYQYAQDGGYTGTEEEFAQKIANELQLDASLKDNTKAAPAGIVGDLKSDIADLEQLIPEDVPTVGKMLKVLSVNEDGTFTCEWADVPSGGGITDVIVRTGNGHYVDGVYTKELSLVSDGVAKIPLATTSSAYGIDYDGSVFKIINASELLMENRNSYFFAAYNPIVPKNFDLMLKYAMCDGKGAAWTDTEKTGAWERLTSIKNIMDEVAVAGARYLLGELTELSVVLPDDALVGQEITVSWYNGNTPSTLSITGNMLDFDFTPAANTRSEISCLWDGTYWSVIGMSQDVPVEEVVADE